MAKIKVRIRATQRVSYNQVREMEEKDYRRYLAMVRAGADREIDLPMAVALWQCGPQLRFDDTPGLKAPIPFEKIACDGYREKVLAHVAQTSNQDAAELYGCTVSQIAAWKAVRSRRAVR